MYDQALVSLPNYCLTGLSIKHKHFDSYKIIIHVSMHPLFIAVLYTDDDSSVAMEMSGFNI